MMLGRGQEARECIRTTRFDNRNMNLGVFPKAHKLPNKCWDADPRRRGRVLAATG